MNPNDPDPTAAVPEPVEPPRSARPPVRPEVRRSEPSRLTRVSLLEPLHREAGARPLRLGLLLVPALLGGLVLAVREIAGVEQVLAAEGARAQRVVVYELPVGGELHARVDPGTDVVRVVVHALRRGGSLAPQPHVARMLVHARGIRGEASDDLALPLPGTATRAAPEDHDVVVGDPLAFNVDLHDVGAGDLAISLAGVEGADAVAIRLYLRNAVEGEALARRGARIDEAGRRHLAVRAGELGFLDVDPEEQDDLLRSRWRKASADRASGSQLRTLAITLARRPERATELAPEPADQTVDLRGDERAAWVVRGPETLRLTADGDEQATVAAMVRDEDGTTRVEEGPGEVVVRVEAGHRAGVEATRTSPGVLSLRASEPRGVEPSGHAVAWRATTLRPLIVDAGRSPLVLRMSTRRPLPRGAAEPTEVALDATLLSPEGEQPTTLRAQRTRSRFDRYESRDPVEAPTESAVFHVVVPAGGSVRLAPHEGTLDVSLSELDPEATPRPVAAYPVDKPPKPFAEVGAVQWTGYVPRRPSNADELGPEARVVVRTPRRFVEVTTPPTRAPTFRIKRPESWEALVIDKRLFDPHTVSYEIDLPPGEPLVLPVRVFAREPLDVVARVDGDVPDRRASGFVERVTTPRSIAVEREVRTVVVLGDDLAPGTHVLTFTPPPGKKAWIHLPWTIKPRLPGTPPRDPHWIEGDLED
jgi:hypothetical protein